MSASLRRALLGDGLSAAGRTQLATWMVATQTGANRLRAGLPATWRIGDKTGTGERGSTNDVAVAWPPGRAPVVVVAYLTDCAAPIERREEALARVARLAAGVLSPPFAKAQ
jgi:beta-lactamase class A